MKNKSEIKETKKVGTLKYRFLIFISFAFLIIWFCLMNIILLSNSFDGIHNSSDAGLTLKEGTSLFLTSYVGGRYVINTKGYITIIGFSIMFLFVVGTLIAYNNKKVTIGKSKFLITGMFTTLLIINSIVFALMILLTPFVSRSSGGLLNALLIPKNDNFGLFQIIENSLINFNKLEQVNFGWIAIVTGTNNSVRFIAGNMYFTLLGFSIMALIVYLFSFIKTLYMIIFQKTNVEKSRY